MGEGGMSDKKLNKIVVDRLLTVERNRARAEQGVQAQEQLVGHR